MMTSFLMFYSVIAFSCVGIASAAFPLQAEIEAEGMACFEMVAAIPQLKIITGTLIQLPFGLVHTPVESTIS